MPALSAKERGILVLRSLKNKTQEDPSWRLKMPPGQVKEFNRYIDLMNGANMRLGYLITVLLKEVEKLKLRYDWSFTLRLWEANLAELNFLASVVAREPISESDYRRLVEKTSAQYASVETLAKILAEHHRAWSAEDLEAFGSFEELVVNDEAWARVCGQAEAEIREAVARGELEGRGKGKNLEVRCGSFDAWFGGPVTTRPMWADGYEVRPESDEAKTQADLVTLSHLQEALATGPFSRIVDDGATAGEGTVTSLAEVMEDGLRQSIPLRWHELRAVELVIDLVAAEFDGEDPLKPVYRADINLAKAILERLARYLECYGKACEFTEPPEEDVEGTRALLENGRHLLP
jgi:hypothetical protein